jgi:hypothetical protein
MKYKPPFKFKLALMSQPSTRIETPLGSLEFLTEFSEAASRGHSLVIAPIQPMLPLGMSVAACFCVLLSVQAGDAPASVLFSAKLRPNAPVTAGAETGQGLEAQVWRSPLHVLSVGTEDAEYLRARLPGGFAVAGDPFDYSPETLSVNIASIPSGESLSLHFVVAWNELPEPKDCSCWYAVDVSHKAAIAAAGANTAVGRPTAAGRSP